jgi:hypothetical protein
LPPITWRWRRSWHEARRDQCDSERCHGETRGVGILDHDSAGHAYLTNTGIDFTFSPDPAKRPQASAFWLLITGGEKIVIEAARKREIDNRVFKYVGVAGVDKPRIVQVGVGTEELPNCR